MKKILCPTDLSDTAQGAIAYAAKLAQVTNSELTLLNIHSVFDFSPAEITRGNHMTLAGIAERLEAESREISKVFRISCYARVEQNFRKLSSAIHANAKEFDLIVMGSDGPDDIYQFFTGTNTYNAIIRNEIPVLLIPSEYVYSEIRSIVYAYDYLSGRNLPLAGLIPFVKALKCELTVLQVMETAYSKKAEDELRELQFLLRNLYDAELTLKYETIRSSDIAQSINSYFLKNEPDVLALCSVHRNFLKSLFHKSIIKNISAYCQYPLFVFHSSK